jgi:hypothetical protein
MAPSRCQKKVCSLQRTGSPAVLLYLPLLLHLRLLLLLLLLLLVVPGRRGGQLPLGKWINKKPACLLYERHRPQ